MLRAVLCLWLAPASAWAGDLYATGFENFTPGPDRIAGAPASGTSPAIPATDGWLGSHAGQDRSGILAESDHAIPGIGHAAYVGGNPSPILSGGAGMFVRKVFDYQPWAPPLTTNEIVTIRLLAGIKDSNQGTRDDFEVLIYNNNQLAGGTGAYPLAGVQFDNSQINPATGLPWQAVYRYGYDASVQAMRYVDTGITFVYDTLLLLELRINYRTNRWSASLEDIPLFQDLEFYGGPQSRNLGSIMIRCQARTPLLPGTNYLLFDDLAVTVDPLPAPAAPDVTWLNGSGARLRWTQESAYRYEVRWSDGASPWLTVPGGAAAPATNTGYTGSLTDSTALGTARRFYQLIRTDP